MIHFSWPIIVDTEQLPALSLLSPTLVKHKKDTIYSCDLLEYKNQKAFTRPEYLSHIWSNLWPDRYQLLSILKPRYKISLLSISTPQFLLSLSSEFTCTWTFARRKRLSLQIIPLDTILIWSWPLRPRKGVSHSWIKVKVRRKENYRVKNEKIRMNQNGAWWHCGLPVKAS